VVCDLASASSLALGLQGGGSEINGQRTLGYELENVGLEMMMGN